MPGTYYLSKAYTKKKNTKNHAPRIDDHTMGSRFVGGNVGLIVVRNLWVISF